MSRNTLKRKYIPQTIFTNRLLWIALISFALTTHAQQQLVGDSLMILSTEMKTGIAHREDTIPLQKYADRNLVNRTWYLDEFYSSLNDSISFLFAYGIAKVFLDFSPDWSIHARDGCYGFVGAYRISKDRRILIQTAGSSAKYCWKATLNACYQRFWRSFCPLLHESRYTICGDSLLLYFQTGKALLIDTAAQAYAKVNQKSWPVATRSPEEAVRWMDSLFQEYLWEPEEKPNSSRGERDTTLPLNVKQSNKNRPHD
jgi:hypothetical protein